MVDITSLLRKLLNDELKKEKNFFGFKKVKLPSYKKKLRNFTFQG